MQITKHKVASIHYTLSDNDGKVLDSSIGQDPLTFIQGIGNLIPGMEEGLEGKGKGEKFKIKVSPEKGYGIKDEKLTQAVPRTSFGTQEVKVGMQFQTGQGEPRDQERSGVGGIDRAHQRLALTNGDAASARTLYDIRIHTWGRAARCQSADASG